MKEEPIDEAVFDNMLYYYSTVVNSALIDNNSGVALRCYNDTKARPHTSTVQGLARKGVRVDTSTYTGHSRVLYAFRDSLPLVVKMVSNEDERLRIDAYLDLKLSHPHIVPVEKVDCHGSVTYYAMPRATTTAAGLIKPITDAVTAKLLTDIMSALEYLHEHGVAHMDIKPDNLGIDVDGNFQLIDLGSLSECGALTDVTEAFVPLEVDATRGQLRAGTEADFWALAITVVKLRGGSKSRYSKQQIRDALLDYGVQGLTIVASLLSKLVAKG
jgi:serine/threonine protein kinase